MLKKLSLFYVVANREDNRRQQYGKEVLVGQSDLLPKDLRQGGTYQLEDQGGDETHGHGDRGLMQEGELFGGDVVGDEDVGSEDGHEDENFHFELLHPELVSQSLL